MLRPTPSKQKQQKQQKQQASQGGEDRIQGEQGLVTKRLAKVTALWVIRDKLTCLEGLWGHEA